MFSSPLPKEVFHVPHEWRELGRMTDGDLIAIYQYLMTLPPVRHEIPKKAGGAPQLGSAPVQNLWRSPTSQSIAAASVRR